jgi:fumarate reductase flavoprotein subunit
MTEGRLMRIRGKAVILATGGTAHPAPEPGLPQPMTEDGIRMAGCAGAAIDYTEEYTYGFGVRKFLPPEFDELMRVMEQPLLFVNKSGERVFDEGLNYQPEMLNVAAYQKDHTLIEIFDEATKDNLINTGVKYLQHGTKFQKLTRLDEQIQEALKRGLIEEAATIRELATKTNVAPANLEKTITQYNQFCDKKHDDVFLKEPEYLEPVRKPPFFAIICNQNFGFSLTREGGVRINTKCQALDASNDIISGLYAVGKDAAGMYGNIYPLPLSGINLTFEIGTGRIAGESAAARA